MSALIAVKFGDRVVLATDSRKMAPNFAEVLSDSEQKIVEVGSGTFYAASGWMYLCDWQAATIQQLGSGGVRDIRLLAETLDLASMPRVRELLRHIKAARSCHPEFEDTLSGAKPFHTYILAGVNQRGVPGFIAREFWAGEDDRCRVKTAEIFEFHADDQSFYAYLTRAERVRDLICDGGTWTEGAVNGVETLLAEICRVEPQVGGPAQMVCIDDHGYRWIHRPSALSRVRLAESDMNTCTVGSGGMNFSGSGGISIFGGGNVNVNPGNVTALGGFNANNPGALGSSPAYQVNGNPVINYSLQFVGNGVYCPNYGVAAGGFNPVIGGTQYFGATFSFVDQGGTTHQVKGGVLVS